MKKLALLLPILLILNFQDVLAFCGFYVAQADANLFNESSEVILVRDGNQTSITMANDFQGDVKDFAMVVPVPVVLQRNQIKVIERTVFERLDGYSGPRLVEYWDDSPCYDYAHEDMAMATESAAPEEAHGEDDGVEIEAAYQIGEYDILILSANESSGLESWLTRNGYQIPDGAQEVLEPYIKSDLKFFVVKVNLEEQAANGYDYLRPIQINFEYDKFMLPIRLGMANSKGNQDLIVYAFTQDGRVETANYRTAEIPSDMDIPLYVKPDFGQFYKDLFLTAWEKEGKNVSFVEYAWNLDSDNYTKCDPCAATPPSYAELQDAGVWWVGEGDEESRQMGGADYTGNLFFTRLHIRYNRETFPQDLSFQTTPNRDLFQGRYVMTHPASDLDCAEGRAYLKQLKDRRQKEVENLASLTGKDLSDDSQAQSYINDFGFQLDEMEDEAQEKMLLFGTLGILMTVVLLLIFWYNRWEARKEREAEEE